MRGYLYLQGGARARAFSWHSASLLACLIGNQQTKSTTSDCHVQEWSRRMKRTAWDQWAAPKWVSPHLIQQIFEYQVKSFECTLPPNKRSWRNGFDWNNGAIEGSKAILKCSQLPWELPILIANFKHLLDWYYQLETVTSHQSIREIKRAMLWSPLESISRWSKEHRLLRFVNSIRVMMNESCWIHPLQTENPHSPHASRMLA